MTENEKFFQWLIDRDGGACAEYKILDDGIYAAIKPLMFHWTLIVGMIGDLCSYEDNWCYTNRPAAEKALREWNGEGEPSGWHRNQRTGRRRPDGDATKEYIDW